MQRDHLQGKLKGHRGDQSRRRIRSSLQASPDKAPCPRVSLESTDIAQAIRHVVLAVFIQPSHLEYIEDIVHVRFNEPERKDCSSQIGVAVEVKSFSAEHLVHLPLHQSSLIPIPQLD